jgi:SET domain-containing protein
MADVYVKESGIHGRGIFAAREFAAGETVLVLDDSRVVDAEHPLRPELGEYEYHCDYLEGGKVVLQGFPERHVNSSCDPNTYALRRGGENRVIARRAIRAGEEITSDYIIDCHGGIVWQCNCGSPRCRKIVPSSFFELPFEAQLEYLPLLNEWFVNEHREEVEALRRLAEGGARAGDDASEA